MGGRWGRGGRGGRRGHNKETAFHIIPCGEIPTGLLALLARTNIAGAILLYISLCAYIGKDPPISLP